MTFLALPLETGHGDTQRHLTLRDSIGAGQARVLGTIPFRKEVVVCPGTTMIGMAPLLARARVAYHHHPEHNSRVVVLEGAWMTSPGRSTTCPFASTN